MFAYGKHLGLAFQVPLAATACLALASRVPLALRSWHPAPFERSRVARVASHDEVQVVDDILDFTQTEEQLGKPRFQDIASGNLTAPTLYAMKKSPALVELIESEFMEEEDALERAVALVELHGGAPSLAVCRDASNCLDLVSRLHQQRRTSHAWVNGRLTLPAGLACSNVGMLFTCWPVAC